MVSLYVTALGYLIKGKSAVETYECLSAEGYLREGADRPSVIALIGQALQTRLDFGDEYWRVVQGELQKAELLSQRGTLASLQLVTRAGERVRR